MPPKVSGPAGFAGRARTAPDCEIWFTIGQAWPRITAEAYALGRRKIQFIGGEPQLNPAFGRLLRRSVDVGFDFVEVFTNLTRLDEATLEFYTANGIHFATSVYSDDPAVHDTVTQVRGSHRRTTGNLRRLIERKVPTRAAVLAIDNDTAGFRGSKPRCAVSNHPPRPDVRSGAIHLSRAGAGRRIRR
ncbi:radical SAM protein [Rhodococcus sp. NPDC003383]